MDDVTRARIRLFVLVFLAFLPAVVLYAVSSATLQERERSRQEQELRQLAAITAVEYQRLIDDSRQLLASLGEFPEIRDAGPECGRRLSSILRHTPQYTTLSLIGSDGYLACGSLMPDGSLYLGDRAYYLLATTNGQFSVGEYAIGRITGKPTVGVAFPIAEGTLRQIQTVLAASIDLSDLGQLSVDALPAYSTLTVVDRAGNVLVRSPAGRHPLGHDTVGARVTEGFPEVAGIASDDPVFVSGTDLDGVERLFAVAPLRESANRAPGAHILVGKEQYMMLSEVEAVARRDLQLLGAGGLVVLLLAWAFGHYGLVRGVRREGDDAPVAA
ncbi:MAG: hypothetical protein RJQ04_13965 [Longimicrobiales bacterium]